MSSVAITGNAAGAGVFTIAAPNSASSFTATLPTATTTLVGTDATQTLTNKTIQGGAITSGTAVASTSGTSIDFTSIPSWVKRITVMLSGVSTSGTSAILIQLGDSGGVEITGYLAAAYNETGGGNSASTAGFSITPTSVAAAAYNGSVILSFLGSNTFVAQGALFRSGTTGMSYIAGAKSLSDTLTQIRITTVNGTDTFDAGSINILYE
jgi:hypothetical protein